MINNKKILVIIILVLLFLTCFYFFIKFAIKPCNKKKSCNNSKEKYIESLFADPPTTDLSQFCLNSLGYTEDEVKDGDRLLKEILSGLALADAMGKEEIERGISKEQEDVFIWSKLLMPNLKTPLPADQCKSLENKSKCNYSLLRAQGDPYLYYVKHSLEQHQDKEYREKSKVFVDSLKYLRVNKLSTPINIILTGPEACFDGIDTPSDDKFDETTLSANLRKINENQIGNVYVKPEPPERNIHLSHIANQILSKNDNIRQKDSIVDLCDDKPLLSWVNTDMIVLLYYILKIDNELAKEEETETNRQKINIMQMERAEEGIWSVFRPNQSEINKYFDNDKNFKIFKRNPKYWLPRSYEGFPKQPGETDNQYYKRVMNENFLRLRYDRAKFRLCIRSDCDNNTTLSDKVIRSSQQRFGRRGKLYQNIEESKWCRPRKYLVKSFLEKRLKEEAYIVNQFKDWLISLGENPKPNQIFMGTEFTKLYTLPYTVQYLLMMEVDHMDPETDGVPVAMWNRAVASVVEIQKRLSEVCLMQLNRLVLQFEEYPKGLKSIKALESDFDKLNKIKEQRKSILTYFWKPKENPDKEKEHERAKANRSRCIQRFKYLFSADTRPALFQNHVVIRMTQKDSLNILLPDDKTANYKIGLDRFFDEMLEIQQLYGDPKGAMGETCRQIKLQTESARAKVKEEVDAKIKKDFPSHFTTIKNIINDWGVEKENLFYYFWNDFQRDDLLPDPKNIYKSQSRLDKFNAGPIPFNQLLKKRPRAFVLDKRVREIKECNPLQISLSQSSTENNKITQKQNSIFNPQWMYKLQTCNRDCLNKYDDYNRMKKLGYVRKNVKDFNYDSSHPKSRSAYNQNKYSPYSIYR
jgi:hypothetical protein